MKHSRLLFILFGLCLLQYSTLAQNLIESFNPARSTISGQWSKSEEGIRVQPGRFSRTVLARTQAKNYKLVVEFTRMSGNDAVGIIIPIGDKVSPVVEFSGWQGGAHGLSRVNGQPTRSSQNPTSKRPGVLENGKRYKAEIEVNAESEPVEVKASLDGQEVFSWKGNSSSLENNLVMFLPQNSAIGLAAQESEALFHSAQLMVQRAPAATTQPAPNPNPAPIPIQPSNSVKILSTLGTQGTPGWEPFGNAAFTTGQGGSIASRPSVGSGDRGAFLQGMNFSEGTIEVELKGALAPQSSFLGVVFHAVDGETYDAIYFRPFNFSSPDPVRKSHGVQYIFHPSWTWRVLRQQRPDNFEDTVTPQPNGGDWFKTKVEVTKTKVRVFVQDSDQACMDIQKLTKQAEGKVGIWFNGVASFRNLKITPTNR